MEFGIAGEEEIYPVVNQRIRQISTLKTRINNHNTLRDAEHTCETEDAVSSALYE